QSWVQGVLDDVIRELPIDRSDARALQPTEPGECKLRPECNICGKTLFDKHSLKKHVDVVHFNIRRFQCQSCPKRFSMKNDLEGHVSAVHHRIKV
ncbi:C2H2-type zinc finger protein, partial [Gelidibacter salicanalis]